MDKPPRDDVLLDDEQLGRSWLRRIGWATVGLVLLAGIAVLVVEVLREGAVPQNRPVTTVMKVLLPPPPTPPKPPPPQPQPQPQKMVEVPKPALEKPKQQEAKKAPPKPSSVPRPPGNPLTAEAGAGPNPYGLGVGNGGGDTIGGGGGGGGGDRDSYYAALIQDQVASALQSNDKTRYANFRGLMVRLWLAPSGQVIRVELMNSTGETAQDALLQRVLATVNLHEAWPSDMPLPAVVRIGTQG
jgi:periplasmic protein TonB